MLCVFFPALCFREIPLIVFVVFYTVSTLLRFFCAEDFLGNELWRRSGGGGESWFL